MEKIKVDIQLIQKEMKQLLRKEWFQKAYIDSSDVTSACRLICIEA